MILRIWKGITSIENSIKYESVLKNVVFPDIQQKNGDGYNGIQLLKHTKENSIQYVTIMSFENWDAVKNFAGDDYETSYVVNETKALLQSYDHKAFHYEVIHNSNLYYCTINILKALANTKF